MCCNNMYFSAMLNICVIYSTICLLQVNKLCDLQSEGDSITSVCWSEDVSMCDVVLIPSN